MCKTPCTDLSRVQAQVSVEIEHILLDDTFHDYARRTNTETVQRKKSGKIVLNILLLFFGLISVFYGIYSSKGRKRFGNEEENEVHHGNCIGFNLEEPKNGVLKVYTYSKNELDFTMNRSCHLVERKKSRFPSLQKTLTIWSLKVPFARENHDTVAPQNKNTNYYRKLVEITIKDCFNLSHFEICHKKSQRTRDNGNEALDGNAGFHSTENDSFDSSKQLLPPVWVFLVAIGGVCVFIAFVNLFCLRKG